MIKIGDLVEYKCSHNTRDTYLGLVIKKSKYFAGSKNYDISEILWNGTPPLAHGDSGNGIVIKEVHDTRLTKKT